MSGVIQLLPDSLANQIAAGEVVQRPASVVKELMENALDAKSTKITLVLKDSGKTLIQVVDNGKGMSETDARLCFERHATSKIKSSDDLFMIRSFGFRGEAMASIAAIAHVELKTKRTEDMTGTTVVIQGSKVVKQEPETLPDGTSVAVRNLFFNVPARRKFLKSDPVELRHILEEFARIALPNPEVFFSVYHNDQELYHFPSANLRQRLTMYFSKSTNEHIVPVSESTDFVKIEGFIGKPEMIKKSRGDQYIFVNQRFIKSNYLNHAIRLAYEHLVPSDHFPFYVLLLDIDPAMIDVNIHPTKQEIKFEDERLIYNLVKATIKHALGKYSVTPSLDFDQDANMRMQSAPRDHGTQHLGPSSPGFAVPQRAPSSERSKWIDFYADLSNQSDSQDHQPITLSSNWDKNDEDQADTQRCFQIADKYIISPMKTGWIVIDQSAAHERILYERHLSSLLNNKSVSQTSLFPETIQFAPHHASILEGLLVDLKYVGLQIEKFGESTFVVNAIPVEGLSMGTEEFIKQFIESYILNEEAKIESKENLARSMAVNMKITGGKVLGKEEMRELIDQLFACEIPYATPGGNKCFVTFGLEEVKLKFNSP